MYRTRQTWANTQHATVPGEREEEEEEEEEEEDKRQKHKVASKQGQTKWQDKQHTNNYIISDDNSSSSNKKELLSLGALQAWLDAAHGKGNLLSRLKRNNELRLCSARAL